MTSEEADRITAIEAACDKDGREVMHKYMPLLAMAGNDVHVIQDKDINYGSSWKRRGGVGAFMMLARKWDRIEQAVEERHDDGDVTYKSIFQVGMDDTRKEDILEDIADLRRYLLLVEDEIRQQRFLHLGADAVKGYVNQD